jgi:hypothetical protein
LPRCDGRVTINSDQEESRYGAAPGARGTVSVLGGFAGTSLKGPAPAEAVALGALLELAALLALGLGEGAPF